MGRWGSTVLNFSVKTNIQIFVLQTSINVLKKIIHKGGSHIWPFHDALRPQRFSPVRERQKKNGFIEDFVLKGGGGGWLEVQSPK